MNIAQEAPNLKLTVGSYTEMRNKVIKEVAAKRFVGPFAKPPFKNYIQSPISLVPKDNGTKTRLIFHLSHPRNGLKQSVNANIPREECVVKYLKDLDDAIRKCIQEGISCKMAKSDMSMAFRNLPMNKMSWKVLVIKM